MARPLIRSLLLVSTLILLPALLAAQGFQGAPPKNLQVLPKSLSRGEVVARMRLMSTALGVRCEFCHVETIGPDGREQTDHASDDKETKKISREMMRMVNDINDKYLIAGMGLTLAERQRVTCETCHHGLAKPRAIQAALRDAIEAKGADSAIALYRDLRSRYYGRASYDFGELAIPLLLPMPQHRPAALALLKLNLEYYPQSAPTYQAIAQVSLQAGDTVAALDALTKAVALAPEDRQMRRELERLKGARPNP